MRLILSFRSISLNEVPRTNSRMITLMSVIVAFLFAISLWYLSSNHKVTSVKLKATYLKFLPNRSWHRLTPAGGTFVSATGGTFQSDMPGTFVSAMRGTIDSAVPGTFESDTGGTFNPLLSEQGNAVVRGGCSIPATALPTAIPVTVRQGVGVPSLPKCAWRALEGRISDDGPPGCRRTVTAKQLFQN